MPTARHFGHTTDIPQTADAGAPLHGTESPRQSKLLAMSAIRVLAAGTAAQRPCARDPGTVASARGRGKTAHLLNNSVNTQTGQTVSLQSRARGCGGLRHGRANARGRRGVGVAVTAIFGLGKKKAPAAPPPPEVPRTSEEPSPTRRKEAWAGPAVLSAQRLVPRVSRLGAQAPVCYARLPPGALRAHPQRGADASLLSGSCTLFRCSTTAI